MRISSALFVVVVLTLVWPSTSAFAQMGFVSGTVVDQQGDPIKDVTIRIEGLDSPRKYKLKTDKKGHYLHAGVPIQGRYRVIAEKKGYQSTYREGIKPGSSSTDERGIVNFEMAKGEAGILAFEMTDEQRKELEKQREEAIKQNEKLKAIKGDFDQGVALYNGGQYEQAVAAFEKVLQTDNSQAVVWANLAAAYAKMDENQKAADAYDKAIAIEPENAGYYQNKASILAAMGKSDEARELYAKAASLSATGNPADAAVNYYNMGVTYINAGQNQEAADALKKAIELDPNHAESHYQLGITLLGMGQVDDAMAQFETYLKLAPNAPNAEVAKALMEQMGGGK
jgi:tetratricopeptide (TPR) repeat protein